MLRRCCRKEGCCSGMCVSDARKANQQRRGRMKRETRRTTHCHLLGSVQMQVWMNGAHMLNQTNPQVCCEMCAYKTRQKQVPTNPIRRAAAMQGFVPCCYYFWGWSPRSLLHGLLLGKADQCMGMMSHDHRLLSQWPPRQRAPQSHRKMQYETSFLLLEPPLVCGFAEYFNFV